jgi:histone acetyltransferase (RNA polymerase elongator complex component)
VPHEAKKFLLPKLKAKPVRTASGVSLIAKFLGDFVLTN